MMNKTLKLAVILCFLSAVFSVSPVLAQRGERALDRSETSNIVRDLDLTSEQKGLLKEQKYQQELQRTETKNNMKLKELQLRHELEKEEINQEAVNKIVEELKVLNGKMLEHRVGAVIKMKGILTPEQFEKMQARHKGGGKRRGRMHGEDQEDERARDTEQAPRGRAFRSFQDED